MPGVALRKSLPASCRARLPLREFTLWKERFLVPHPAWSVFLHPGLLQKAYAGWKTDQGLCVERALLARHGNHWKLSSREQGKHRHTSLAGWTRLSYFAGSGYQGLGGHRGWSRDRSGRRNCPFRPLEQCEGKKGRTNHGEYCHFGKGSIS